MVGNTLGHYKILEPLGAGGMGEVYLGEDPRLGRKVAIKVLPAEFASDPERLARFEQEARAAAALNHPHIAVVHDVGAEDGEDGATTHFMVQEHLEGESLRERLDKGALPLDKALHLAIEVGEALIAAHKAGIVHRDLKPDNIFVTTTGHAKVLDFGLAKLVEMSGSAGTSMSMSPTILGTVAGQVMGTAGYMAPEQINGEEVDHRTDLFAFGCVLYGMVTGRQAFPGKNVHETLGKILSEEPPSIADIDDSLPAELHRILRKTLAKSPDNRYQTAGDLVVDLRVLGADVESGATQPLSGKMPTAPVAPPPKGGSRWKSTVLLVVVTALVAVAITWLSAGTATSPPVRRFQIPYPDDTTFQSQFNRGLAISPDGTHIVFNADRQLWKRAIGEFDAEPIRGTETARSPFFSPDSQQLGFWAGDGQMKKVAVTGGAPVSLGAAPVRPYGASWADDGNIYFGQGPGGIFRVSENGGEPELVVTAEEGESVGAPQLLPGGEWLLFTLSNTGSWVDASIVAQSLSSGDRKVLVSGGTDGRYVPTGHLVYVLDGNLLAAPFDLEAVERTSGPVAVVEGVSWTNGSGAGQYAFSRQGGLVYMPGGVSSGTFNLAWVDRGGDMELLPFAPSDTTHIDLSPDESKVAVEILGEEGTYDIWILDIDRRAPLRLTAEGSNRNPIWSPDGEWIFFASDRGGDWDIWRQRADRSEVAELVWEGENIQRPFSISADGSTLLFDVGGPGGPVGQDIGILTLAEDAPTAELVQATPAAESVPGVSPDGRYFAFASDESGGGSVYVREIASGQITRVTPDSPSGSPSWSRDGSEIVFATPSALWSAAVVTEPELSISPPQMLFQVPRRNFSNIETTADGQRFLLVVSSFSGGEVSETGYSISVVLNWFEELTQRVPTGR